MKTIAIIGAGPNLGLSLAQKFGMNNFQVALVSRHQETLNPLKDELTEMGIATRTYIADVRDNGALSTALKQISRDFGSIDVVEFSPYAGPQDFRNVEEIQIKDVHQQLEMTVFPAMTIVQTVLPEMKQRGSGAILFNSGISAVMPIPQLGNTGIATAGLRNYAQNLHNVLKNQGIYVGFLAVAAEIKRDTAGDPDLIAGEWFNLYNKHDQFETIVPDLRAHAD